jgi:hypothetical protein
MQKVVGSSPIIRFPAAMTPEDGMASRSELPLIGAALVDS